jgi:hypothetical protein
MRSFDNSAANLSARYPVGWYVAKRSISHVIRPKQRFAVATFPLRRYELRPTRFHGRLSRYGPPLAELPKRLPPRSALIYVQEFGGRYLPRDPPRPAHFTLNRRDTGLAGCTFARSWPGYMLVWREKGRTFAANIHFGAGASARTRSEALKILDSVRVGNRPAHVRERAQ